MLIGHHDEEGAVGVVLNREAPLTVGEAAPPLAPLVDEDAALFLGGPVQPTSAVVVADFEDPRVPSVVAFGSIGFLPDEADAGRPRRPAPGPRVRRLRRVGGGTARGELAEGSWFVEPAEPEDVFTPDPQGSGHTSCAARARSTSSCRRCRSTPR